MQLKALLGGQVLTAVVMLAIFVTMSLMALGFPEKARLMPLMIGIPGSVLALVQVLRELRTAIDKVVESDEEQRQARRNERHMFIWMLLFFFGFLGFGFVYAAPLLVFGFLRIGMKESLTIGVIGAVATWAVLYGLFEQAFEIPLFDGLLIEWILN
ncbi:MAG: tripartite tricarboxylate transporter TctB family protein [Proteobacteria bacterium]|nr:tripartite tricarboxylate transporter TctB family protein [Pseudomonadota bacterium]